MPNVFFSDNISGTMADALKAVGLAEVLSMMVERLRDADTAARVVLRDCGAYYQIELPISVEVADIARIAPFVAGYGKVLHKDKGDAPLGAYPYEQHKQARDDYFKQRAKLLTAKERERFDTHPEEFNGVAAPDSDLPLYISVNHFKAADAYNGLLEQWQGGVALGFEQNLRVLLETFARHPNDLIAAETLWSSAGILGKATPTQLQVVNPTTGKGGNSLKANGLGIGNLDGFWLGEYLKFIGYFTIAVPVIIKGSKDRKTYVLHPKQVDLGTLRDLMRRFREGFRASTPVKTDILASLRFAQTFMQTREQQLVAQTGTDRLKALIGRAPKVTDISTGFDMALYKDMGAAYATMNQATINLPDWLRAAETVAAAQADSALLDEHSKVINSIRTSKNDEGADEFALLRRYRDFLSGHETVRFFAFAAHFGDYYLAHRHRNQWVAQFTTEGMETLMTQGQGKEQLFPIIDDEGFKAIAKAIRQATVLAQYHAARKQGSYVFEVRYGLGQELLRAAAYPKDFIGALSTFLHSFNAENARVDERITKGTLANLPQNRRASVRITHVDAIVALVDTHGSDVVCKLLVAYGYARDPKTPQDDAPTDEHAPGMAEGDDQ